MNSELYKEYHRVTDDAIYGFFDQYAFLSNFYPATVLYEGATYESVEHAYQAAKTHDKMARIPFHNGDYTAGKAKKEGRKLTVRPDWERVKYRIMLGLVFDKFHRDALLGASLVETGGKYLEETNHWGDNTWGVDYRASYGTNWLGQILMDVRKCLRSEALIAERGIPKIKSDL